VNIDGNAKPPKILPSKQNFKIFCSFCIVACEFEEEILKGKCYRNACEIEIIRL